mgnify:CR=1 FL=1
MKRLEETLRDSSGKEPELRKEIAYEGLKLVEDKEYMGYTSVKYWM